MKNWILKTAWPMTPPAPYSLFHLGFSIAGILVAIAAAYKLSHTVNAKTFYKILFFCGVFLTTSEIYKQFFLYYVVNSETYDWWYFPFQLCSLPMYFCLLLPLIRAERLRLILCTFMQDFNLLGGIMALAEPSGLMHPYWFLTIHGLLWHITLIFIGLLIGFHRQSDRSIKGYFNTLPLFAVCCVIASLINVTAHPLGRADMFYISPYYPSGQVVFHQIALQFGVLAGNVTYLFAICLGGLLCHICFTRLLKRSV